jgi:hypothetical protein
MFSLKSLLLAGFGSGLLFFISCFRFTKRYRISSK